MRAESDTSGAAPDSAGIGDDVPCPKCEYNLRGLVVPRCPECGLEFRWSDLPEFIRFRPDKPSARDWARLAGALLVVVLVVVFWPITVGLLAIASFATLVASAAAAQSLLELVMAWPIIGPSPLSRRRAWWEGVLAGYGLCAATLFATGWGLIPLGADPRDVVLGPGPLLALLAVESLLMQWWVVRWRCGGQDEAMSAPRLLLACVLVKAVIVAAAALFVL